MPRLIASLAANWRTLPAWNRGTRATRASGSDTATSNPTKSHPTLPLNIFASPVTVPTRPSGCAHPYDQDAPTHTRPCRSLAAACGVSTAMNARFMPRRPCPIRCAPRLSAMIPRLTSATTGMGHHAWFITACDGVFAITRRSGSGGLRPTSSCLNVPRVGGGSSGARGIRTAVGRAPTGVTSRSSTQTTVVASIRLQTWIASASQVLGHDYTEISGRSLFWRRDCGRSACRS